MGLDLATFLSVYGAAFDGNLTHFSIHNMSKPGLSGSHNNYESDASPTRCDFFKCGRSAFKLQPDQYKAMYDLGENITLSGLEKLRVARFQDSINTNPYFFNGIFSGVLVQPAAYTFIYRFMANKSSEFPEGYLNRDVLGSFFSVRTENGSFIYTPGHERIPDNWYKRALDDPYTIPFFLLDVVKMAVNHPQFLSVGGNTNGVNTFTGVDPGNLTDGVYNIKNLLDPKNLMCFSLQLSQQGPQPLFQQLGITFNAAVAAIARLFGNLTSKFGCPQLIIDPVLYEGYLMNYPGWMRSLQSTVR
ncbi:unnamed protein product [Bemisia tabaci]|uniref:Heme haloperoxidase family profile domain-containing protein n=2 Tax=Bemisia tabaci TaxID=7038 RepID=A0A9P0EWZ3_BEMTA|nr:unnamed protein product [Bemisia tabaci]